jgi:DNA-binding transcriptional ArsR family regulator
MKRGGDLAMAVTADAADTPSPGAIPGARPGAISGAPGPAGPEAPPEALPEALEERARAANRFLKALSNETRLRLLWLLAEGEKSVSELERALGLRQPAISQQLARLRAERLVAQRRQGKSVYYSLASEEARRALALLHDLFSAPPREE